MRVVIAFVAGLASGTVLATRIIERRIEAFFAMPTDDGPRTWPPPGVRSLP